MNVLVLDVGSTHIKTLATGRKEPLKIRSGPKMTVKEMVRMVRYPTTGWHSTVVSMSYPGPMLHGKPVSEPRNLGGGGVGFDFEKAFGCQTTANTIEESAELHERAKRSNLLIKTLGTPEGVAAIEESIATGVPVNVRTRLLPAPGNERSRGPLRVRHPERSRYGRQTRTHRTT